MQHEYAKQIFDITATLHGHRNHTMGIYSKNHEGLLRRMSKEQ